MEGFEIQRYCDDNIIYCYYTQSNQVCNGECGLKCQIYKNWLEVNKSHLKNNNIEGENN